MKTILLLSILLFDHQPVSAQKEQDTSYYKKYFFGNAFVKNGAELVVITKRPQTELAREIGSRIYSDSATLRYIEQQFFCWKRKGEEIYHYCDFDLYFYRKKGDLLEYLSCANSHCGISELGGGDRDMCSNIEFLAENGTKLVADTIYSFPDSIRSKSMMREIYFQDHIYSEFRDKDSEGGSYGYRTKSVRHDPFYYDGYLLFDVPSEWMFEEEEFLNQQLLSMGIEVDLKDPRVNWDADGYHHVCVYFTSDHPLFDAGACEPMRLPTKPGYRFDPPLLLWRMP